MQTAHARERVAYAPLRWLCVPSQSLSVGLIRNGPKHLWRTTPLPSRPDVSLALTPQRVHERDCALRSTMLSLLSLQVRRKPSVLAMADSLQQPIRVATM